MRKKRGSASALSRQQLLKGFKQGWEIPYAGPAAYAPPASTLPVARDSEPTSTGAAKVKYRSRLKRAIKSALLNNPSATDLSICRTLDEDGTALPRNWEPSSGDRTFVSAYRNPLRKGNVESAISKVRTDMRKAGLLH